MSLDLSLENSHTRPVSVIKLPYEDASYPECYITIGVFTEGLPPSRPTAPKPAQPGELPVGAPMPGAIPVMPGALGGFIPDLPDSASSLNAPRAPTLKDYLPFMKPQTFGPKSARIGQPEPVASPGGMPLDQYGMYAGVHMNQIPQVPTHTGRFCMGAQFLYYNYTIILYTVLSKSNGWLVSLGRVTCWTNFVQTYSYHHSHHVNILHSQDS